jgi:hypothetical protein
MPRRTPQQVPFRCHAIAPDGAVSVFFAATATPESAANIVRAIYDRERIKPVKILVYRGGEKEPRGPVLLEWDAR